MPPCLLSPFGFIPAALLATLAYSGAQHEGTTASSPKSEVSVLIIRPKWLDLILTGRKVWEIRGVPSRKVGEVIHLAASGSATIMGRATLEAVHGPLSGAQWDASFSLHRVPSATRSYGSHTYAWALKQVEIAQRPLAFKRNAAVIFQTLRVDPRELVACEFCPT